MRSLLSYLMQIILETGTYVPNGKPMIDSDSEGPTHHG